MPFLSASGKRESQAARAKAQALSGSQDLREKMNSTRKPESGRRISAMARIIAKEDENFPQDTDPSGGSDRRKNHTQIYRVTKREKNSSTEIRKNTFFIEIK
jgi:hypothetical protein